LLGSKILLDTDLKIILLKHQNNFGTLKIMCNAIKDFVILAIYVSVLRNYLDSSTHTQNYFSGSANILDLLPFFPCIHIKNILCTTHFKCFIILNIYVYLSDT